MMIWDDLGIFVHTDPPKKDEISTVAVAFHRNPTGDLDSSGTGQAVRPKRTFTGKAVIGSVRSNGDMKIGDIPAASNMTLEVH